MAAEAVDAKEEFAEHHCLPALMANALYEDKYPLSTAIGRPLIAKKLVQTAHKYGATAVAHGCTGKGNDQVRIDIGVRSQDPNLQIVAPARGADWPSREELLDYVAAHGIQVNLTKKSPYSIDENLWGRSNECGVLEDPWVAPPEDAFQFVKSVAEAPDKPQHVMVSFEQGKPVALDGEAMDFVTLIETIDEIGNEHGFGRVDMIENRLVGIKSREVYEVAGSLALITAHRELEDLVLTRDLLHFKRTIESKLSDMIYEGQWFDPLTEACKAFLFQSQERVTRRRATQVPQGQLRRRRSPQRLQPVQLQARHLHDRGRVLARGGRRVHRAVGPADRGLGTGRQGAPPDAGARGRGAGQGVMTTAQERPTGGRRRAGMRRPRRHAPAACFEGAGRRPVWRARAALRRSAPPPSSSSTRH